ncbi:MAG: endolytic transglycosylase MltG [Chloroflexi bacterium]|nr:MAG: endolytic transglycosylase MltG [Chloroflexota bacterium]
MTGRQPRRREQDELRDARIRALRQQREAPASRRKAFQPLILLVWFGAVVAAAAGAIFIGLLALAPQLMSWVEDHPGSVDNGLVRDFVQWYQPDALADVPAASSGARITIIVEQGATDADIGHLLFQHGLVRSELAFQWAVQQAGRSGDLQAGVYDLSPTLTPSQIVAALRQVPGVEVTITIREGWRLEQIAAYLATTNLTMNVDEFAALARTPPADLLAKYDFLADLPAGRSLEGYLYPDTYRVDEHATAREVLEKLLDTFGLRLTPEIRDQIAARTIGGSPMTIDQAVTLASIVEREAVLDAERPIIAAVYINRLITPGWRLQADPTLQYGVATAAHGGAPVNEWGTIEWWAPLQDLGYRIVLPDELLGYQTYRSDGLPPSPISAPRIASIQAVATPDLTHGYFFFVAGCPNGTRDGSHYFAVTLAEHNANIAKANAECPPA